MTVTKKNISTHLAKNLNISSKKGELLLESFLSIIKNHSKKNAIKISNFGTFKYKITPKRIGRNPKTGLAYDIDSFKRFTFKPNNGLKKTIN